MSQSFTAAAAFPPPPSPATWAIPDVLTTACSAPAHPRAGGASATVATLADLSDDVLSSVVQMLHAKDRAAFASTCTSYRPFASHHVATMRSSMFS